MAYNKKASKDAIEETKEKYQLMVVDADTLVFRASKFIQEDYITVKKKGTDKEIEYPNKTEFYGHWGKKSGGHLAKINESRIKKGKDPYSVDDFEIVEHVRLLDVKNFDKSETHLEEAVKIFDTSIGHLKKFDLAEDYLLLIGGEGNYRYEYAQTLPYKGKRADKPLLFLEVKEAILEKYGNKVEVVHAKEVDDEMAVWGYSNQVEKEDTGSYPYILAYIDKDLDMIVSPSVNYDKPEEGVRDPDELECMRCYCKQLLIGDKSVDNIQGLPNLHEVLREKYGIRKGKGLGDKTALDYLSTAKSCREMLERVVSAYIAYYGTGFIKFDSYDGVELTWDWIDFLQETAMLIYMNPLDNPLDYHIEQTLDEYDVDYALIEKEWSDSYE